MVFINTARSLPSLNFNRIGNHTDHTSNGVSIARPVCYKTNCKPCRRVCPRILAKWKSQSRAQHRHRSNDNFVLISARYVTELYHWTKKHLFTDDFMSSVVASAILFAIGVKLTTELNACNL